MQDIILGALIAVVAQVAFVGAVVAVVGRRPRAYASADHAVSGPVKLLA